MTIRTSIAFAAMVLAFGSTALAQDADGDIELGANGTARTNGATTTYNGDRTSSSSSVRIGLQIRLDALNVLGPVEATPGTVQAIGRRLLVPLAAPGVRLIDNKLFLGLGLGFYGYSTEDDDNNGESRSGFGLSPLATFDVLRDGVAALSIGGALHIASMSEREVCGPGPGGCMDADDGASAIGLSLGAGLRGDILPGLALGGDFGWGFLSVSYDNNNDDTLFIHGIYAAILLEATIGV